MPKLQMPARTVVVKAELDLDGEYDRDVEFVLTSDFVIGQTKALKIFEALYPNRCISNVEIVEL